MFDSKGVSLKSSLDLYCCNSDFFMFRVVMVVQVGIGIPLSRLD